MDRFSALAAACATCRACPLAAARSQVVLSRGNPRARLMLIGEAPGAQEDATGQPFVGRAGQLLDQLLSGAAIDPGHDCFIVNVVKCRPPGNRKPTPVEMAACRPWLEQQIQLVDPPLVVLVGATALQALLGIKAGITSLRGQWHSSDSPVLRGRRLMPILHPSYLLRNPTPRPGGPVACTAADLQEVRRQLDACL